jgi:hypothetical protein
MPDDEFGIVGSEPQEKESSSGINGYLNCQFVNPSIRDGISLRGFHQNQMAVGCAHQENHTIENVRAVAQMTL